MQWFRVPAGHKLVGITIKEKMAYWTLDDGRRLTLITPAQLRALPKGVTLTCIDGSTAVVGQDRIDDDTHGGFIAYGYIDDLAHLLDKALMEAR